MGIAGQTNFARAQATYTSIFQSVFASMPKGTWSQWTQKISNASKTYEINVLTSLPRVRQWLGAKQFKDLRAYRQAITILKYEVSLMLDRFDVEYDPTNIVAQTISQFMSQNEMIFEDIMTAALVANPTGYDGVSLIHDSHPNTGGNADNSLDAQLSFTSLRTATESMGDIADEDGNLLGFRPTHLLAGPQLQRTAYEVAGPMRPVAMSNAGALDATSNVVASTQFPNYDGQNLTVMIDSYITDDSYLFMDLSKGVRPMLWIENRPLTAITMNNMDDEGRFTKDHYRFSLETDGAPGAGPWQIVCGEFNPS